MTASSKSAKELRVISLETKAAIVRKTEHIAESEDLIAEEMIVAPFLLDETEAIEDIGELIGKVYEEFSTACDQRNLKWEAELEIGLQFGVKFAAKLKISPKNV